MVQTRAQARAYAQAQAQAHGVAALAQTQAPASSDPFPADVKLAIVEHLLEYSDRQMDENFTANCPGFAYENLLSTSATSRAWHDVVLPYMYRDINLSRCKNAEIKAFLQIIAPKYSHFCRSLSFSLRVHDQDFPDRLYQAGSVVGDISDMEDSDTEYFRDTDSEETSRWERMTNNLEANHAERDSLLSKAILSIPRLNHIRVSVWDCKCYKYDENPADVPRCQCLATYCDVVQSLSKHALKSMTVLFASFADNGRDVIVSSLLHSVRETLESVIIDFIGADFGFGDSVGSFRIRETLDVLTSLPHLQKLTLADVCNFRHLRGLTWSSPLRMLTLIPDFEDNANEDVSLALQNLPDSLEFLEIRIPSNTFCHYKASVPFPPQLRVLRTLRLDTSHTFAMLITDYFSPCHAHNVSISNRWAPLKNTTTYMDNLVAAVKTRQAFPEVEDFELIYPHSRPPKNKKAPRVRIQFEAGRSSCHISRC